MQPRRDKQYQTAGLGTPVILISLAAFALALAALVFG